MGVIRIYVTISKWSVGGLYRYIYGNYTRFYYGTTFCSFRLNIFIESNCTSDSMSRVRRVEKLWQALQKSNKRSVLRAPLGHPPQD